MQIAILTFDGFNEIDSFVACNVLNRIRGWKASIAAPVGEKDLYIDRAIADVRPFVVPSALQGAAS